MKKFITKQKNILILFLGIILFNVSCSKIDMEDIKMIKKNTTNPKRNDNPDDPREPEGAIKKLPTNP